MIRCVPSQARQRTRNAGLASSRLDNAVMIHRTGKRIVSRCTKDPSGNFPNKTKNREHTFTLRSLQVTHPFLDFVCLRFCRITTIDRPSCSPGIPSIVIFNVQTCSVVQTSHNREGVGLAHCTPYPKSHISKTMRAAQPP